MTFLGFTERNSSFTFVETISSCSTIFSRCSPMGRMKLKYYEGMIIKLLRRKRVNDRSVNVVPAGKEDHALEDDLKRL